MDMLVDSYLSEFSEQLKPGQISVALFQALPDVIFWIKDKDGRFIYVNKAFCHDVAVKEALEIIGLKDEDLFPRELAVVFQQGDEKVLRSREAMWNQSELVPNRSGQVEWRSTSKIPLQSVEGDWVGTAGISRKMGRGGESMVPGRHQKIVLIVESVYENLEKGIGVSELAAATAVSVSTLERLFKEHMNTTPRRFILQVKMSAACDRLLNTGMQIKEIASSLGYEEHANFTRAFTKVMGMSPRAYQRHYRP
jgi:PAS domain S-box-containing protein